ACPRHAPCRSRDKPHVYADPRIPGRSAVADPSGSLSPGAAARLGGPGVRRASVTRCRRGGGVGRPARSTGADGPPSGRDCAAGRGRPRDPFCAEWGALAGAHRGGGEEMLILALETTGELCSVAVWDG